MIQLLFYIVSYYYLQHIYNLKLMQLVSYLYKKINDEMRIVYITQNKPKRKIKLDSLDPQDLNIDISTVQKWSENNKQLYQLLQNNGMAEFICNREFLNQFYNHLQFMYSGIIQIDINTLKLSNLKVLNLFHNKIQTLQNIPSSCRQLYIDFNQINKVNIKKETMIELLSISHNQINDSVCCDILAITPYLRCLNISHNKIQAIKKFVDSLKQCKKLKILIAKYNPIAMLQLYAEYINESMILDSLDNQKYVKPIVVQKVQEPPKQQKKEQKKQTKKDNRKGGKVQEKQVQQQKPIQIKVEAPKIKTEENYTQVKLIISINELQNFNGNIYDTSLFPQQNLKVDQTQSCFWLELELMGKKYNTKQKKICMDSFVPQNQINRLNFQFKLEQSFPSNYQNMLKFIEGLTVYVFKEQPLVETDSQMGEQKVILNEQKKIKLQSECIGGNVISFQDLLSIKCKKITKNFNLFEPSAVKQPLFKKPYQNQKELIFKNKVQFDTNLAAKQQEKRKKQAEDEALKAKKKGGKDTKKAPAKKQTKKDAKQLITDKKSVTKCSFPIDEQEYRYLGENKMFKYINTRLGVKVVVQ